MAIMIKILDFIFVKKQELLAIARGLTDTL